MSRPSMTCSLASTCFGFRCQPLQKWVPFDSVDQGPIAQTSHTIILPLRALLGQGFAFPLGMNQPLPFQPAQRRVHRPTREAGDIHDVETVAVAMADSLQNQSGGV